MTDLVIVGSGLFGLTIAERTSNQLGLNVLIIEKRHHIGGNAYSEIDTKTGIEIHKYGTHIFHTSHEKTWAYVNQFTNFNNYVHRVWAIHNGLKYQIPINLSTINQFFETDFSPSQAENFMEQEISKDLSDINSISNLEDKAISLIGSHLYKAFIKNYTWKQWQTDPKNLPAEIITRLPVRYSKDDRYFNDKYEGIPLHGYTKWFERMIDNPKIELKLNCDFFELKSNLIGNVPIVYTGALDRYFDYSQGNLSWRTLDFVNEIHEIADYQGTSVINFSDLDPQYTRIHEFKHLHPERKSNKSATYISKEFSRFADSNDEPYYPINTSLDRERLNEYRKLVNLEKQNSVWFGGRLGSYQYLDMHMAIASALNLYENEIMDFFN